jgi:hypothetical protein
VRITIITKFEVIHDEWIVDSRREWRWLCCVARRPLSYVEGRRFKTLVHVGASVMYEFGPATNVLTQPSYYPLQHSRYAK